MKQNYMMYYILLYIEITQQPHNILATAQQLHSNHVEENNSSENEMSGIDGPLWDSLTRAEALSVLCVIEETDPWRSRVVVFECLGVVFSTACETRR